MNTLSTVTDGPAKPKSQETSIQTYARIAGVLLLLTLIGGGFGEAYVPSKLLSGSDANATAENFRAYDYLFRLGFAGYLVEAVCDIGLSLVFFVLLKPVHKNLALLAAFFGLVSTAVFAGAELFNFGASRIFAGANYLNAFSPEQQNALGMLFLKVFGYGGGIFMALYGIASLLRGYLILRSRYLPKFLGILLMMAGAGFVANNLAVVIAPYYSSDFLALPMFLAALSMTVWFLAKGVNIAKLENIGGVEP
ncbi:MAG: DUF4386 domain-containing protein [Acidobacteria bacterium]|nr:DUF4386 domain-containing protein [Acidobacteriota bacterium]